MKAFRYKEMKIYLHDAGHMTKMAAMPIYGKNLQKSSSPEPAGQISRNLVCKLSLLLKRLLEAIQTGTQIHCILIT